MTTLRATGLMGRFALLGMGVWLHAADSLVTATIAPAIVEDLGDRYPREMPPT